MASGRGLDDREPKPKADWQTEAGYPSRCPECGDCDWPCDDCYDAGTAFDDDSYRDVNIDTELGVR